jgi:hypothetical protein
MLLFTHAPCIQISFQALSKYLLLPKLVQLYAHALKVATFLVAVKTHSDANTTQGVIRIIQENLPLDANKKNVLQVTVSNHESLSKDD